MTSKKKKALPHCLVRKRNRLPSSVSTGGGLVLREKKEKLLSLHLKKKKTADSFCSYPRKKGKKSE